MQVMHDEEMTRATGVQRIAGYLCPEEIVLDLDVPDKEQALQAAAAAIAQTHGLKTPPVFRALWRREQVGSTALGQGVAIPHARISGIDRPLTVYLRPKQAIPFDAPDGKPVSMMLVIMVPADGATDDHLELLALVARMFSDSTFRHRLQRVSDFTEARRTFREWVEQVSHSP
jgi:PTS system nitrogen regulatory IIA component